MSPLDTFMFDWFGDTLLNVVLFNLVLFWPASFATGQGVAITWRHWAKMVFYTGLLSATLRFLDYALGGGELWSAGGFLLGWAVQFAMGAFAESWTGVISDAKCKHVDGTEKSIGCTKGCLKRGEAAVLVVGDILSL